MWTTLSLHIGLNGGYDSKYHVATSTLVFVDASGAFFFLIYSDQAFGLPIGGKYRIDTHGIAICVWVGLYWEKGPSL